MLLFSSILFSTLSFLIFLFSTFFISFNSTTSLSNFELKFPIFLTNIDETTKKITIKIKIIKTTQIKIQVLKTKKQKNKAKKPTIKPNIPPTELKIVEIKFSEAETVSQFKPKLLTQTHDSGDEHFPFPEQTVESFENFPLHINILQLFP